MNYDLVVIGAGPAGMSAAIKAAANGARVALIDENPIAGGKLLGQLHKEPGTGWWIGKQVAKYLAREVKSLGVDCFQERVVWGVFPNWTVKLNKGEELETSYVLIATGAAENAIPIPGWTIPGVMAVGAAQVLNNYHRVQPGKKIAVIGADPLSLTVSQELQMAGAEVVGIYLPPLSDFSQEQSDPRQMIAYLSSMAHLAPNKTLRLAGKMARNKFVQSLGARFYPRKGMKAWNIPLFLRKTVVEIEGHEQVERIKTAHIRPDGMFDRSELETTKVDCVCISGGLYPLAELAGAAGCNITYIEELGGHVPLHSPELETTQPGIFVAGNSTGVEGAKIAMAQGELAGTVISARLDLVKADPDVSIKRAQEKVQVARKNAVITFRQNVEYGREKLNQWWKRR